MKLAIVAVTALVLASPAVADTIQVNASRQHHNYVAFKPIGRAGDAESSNWVIRDRTGSAIGDLLTDCRWVTNNFRLCVAQITMPLGALFMLGSSRTKLVGQFAIVGGTGRYNGAQGTLWFNATSINRYTLSAVFQPT